jgi:hypothetical protein
MRTTSQLATQRSEQRHGAKEEWHVTDNSSVFASPTAAYTDLDPVYIVLVALLIVGPLLVRFGMVRWPALAVPFAFGRLVLKTRLTPAECAARLRVYQGRKFSVMFFSPGLVDGIVTSEGFVLRKHISGWPVAAGTFRQGPTGTTVGVRIGPFVAIWLFMVLVLLVAFNALLGYGQVIACWLCSIAPLERLLPPLILAGVTASVIVWVVSKGFRSDALNELRTLMVAAFSADR